MTVEKLMEMGHSLFSEYIKKKRFDLIFSFGLIRSSRSTLVCHSFHEQICYTNVFYLSDEYYPSASETSLK